MQRLAIRAEPKYEDPIMGYSPALWISLVSDCTPHNEWPSGKGVLEEFYSVVEIFRVVQDEIQRTKKDR